MFDKASVPDLSEFKGEYLVDMVTGLPSLRVFSHRKVFALREGVVVGHNVLFGGLRWGGFFMEYADHGPSKVAVINYDRPGNTFITKKIRDHVRCMTKGALYLGRFNYLCAGRPRFLGYFVLEKG